jgi:L-threonylcarbamoyladenylate synthase
VTPTVTRRLHDARDAAAILAAGGLVAFPTETVYGVGADALQPAAVRRIFSAKGRPADNPLIVHVAALEEAEALAVWDARARALARRHWPGPLTVVLPSLPHVPPEVRGGLSTVALRCPAHPLAQALLRAFGGPVAAPSANRSGRPSPTTADAVLEDLGGRIDAVLDGGPCPYGVESTVVDLSGPEVRLLRPGALPAEELGLPPLPAADAPVRSPGMRHRHYAPAVPLRLVEDLRRGLAECPAAAVLCTAATAGALGLGAGPRVHVWGPTDRHRAAELFAALRRLERSGAPCILAEALPPRGLDAATMDRLRRAASAGGDEEGRAPGGAQRP